MAANEGEMRFSGDASQLLREYMRVVAAEKDLAKEARATSAEMRRGVAEVNKELKRLADEKKQIAVLQRDVFGPKAINQVVSWAAAIGAATVAARALLNVQQDINAANQRAAQGQRQAAPAMGELLQLATSREHLQTMVGQARRLRQEGGAESLEEAYRTVFGAYSTDQQAQLGYISRLRQSGILTTPGETVKAIGTIRTAFGAERTGNFQQVLSKGLAAAGPSPGSMEQLLEAVSFTGSGAALNGLTLDEMLAAGGILAKATGSPAEGVTQLNALLRTLSDKQFKGRTLAEAIQDFQGARAAGIGEGQLQEVFGRQEGLKAFTTLSANLGDYRGLLGKVSAAGRRDLAAERANLALTDPTIAAQLERRAMEGRAEITRQPVADRDTLNRARLEEMAAEADTNPWYLGGKWTARATVWAQELKYRLGFDVSDSGAGQQTTRRPLFAEEQLTMKPTPGPADRPYKPKALVFPQVPETEDPRIVGVESQLAVFEKRQADRRAQLLAAAGADGRLTAREEQRMSRDPAMQQLALAIEKLNVELSRIRADRKINAGTMLGTQNGPPGGR